MTDSAFIERRNTRTRQYGSKPLDPSRCVALRIGPTCAGTYAGQVALLTAANLIGRMTQNVALDLPADVRLREPLPWAGRLLRDVVIEQMHAATPPDAGARFTFRPPAAGDCIFSFGRETLPGASVVYGSGWNAYVGSAAAPLPLSASTNPCGPAFAAILAGAHLMTGGLRQTATGYLCNTLSWSSRLAPGDAPEPDPAADLGEVWTIGTGSVGTAALYFLTLFTRRFGAALIDKDHVEIENLDRSPIFVAADDARAKVEATADYLRGVGVERVRAEACTLDESTLWNERQEREPDIIVAAANEDHVRYQIEAGMPPIQIYATTGKNWQASLIRHIPLRDPCSLCLFPDTAPVRPMACATGTVRKPEGKQIDAALPFLSFAAGLMTAAEILKLPLPGYPFSQAPVHFWSRAEKKLVPGVLGLREACLCQQRDRALHRQMVAGSKYAHLSFHH